MAEAGIFHPEARLELIDGELIEMSPQGSRHAAAIRRVEEALRRAYESGVDVRVQLPLTLSETDQPEPDVAVVPGHFDDYVEAHPAEAVLVVEVADTSLDFDRTRKLSRYARASVPVYWIVDVQNGALEVYRDPAGATYQAKATHRAGSVPAPHAPAGRTVSVNDLLP